MAFINITFGDKKKASKSKKAKEEKKGMDFSKKLLLTVSFFTIIITVFTMAIIWKTGDTSALAYLIPSCFAELATATGFYLNKAKAENLSKYSPIQNNNNEGDVEI